MASLKKKPRKGDADAPAAPAAPAAPMEEERSFARGKPASTSLLAHPHVRGRAPASAADDDVLFGARRPSAATSASSSTPASKRSRPVAQVAGAASSAAPRAKSSGPAGPGLAQRQREAQRATLLTFRQLRVGMLLLGCVREINELDVTVSLPHGLTGYISLREVSDVIAAVVDEYLKKGDDAEEEEEDALPKLESLFTPGQLVRVAVLHLDTKEQAHRIELSMRASLVNRHLTPAVLRKGMSLLGCVRSVEDKGYTVDLSLAAEHGGTADVSGFLPFAAAAAAAQRAENDGEEAAAEARLPVGRPVEVLVTADPAPGARVLQLSAEPERVAAAAVPGKRCALSLQQLQAGMLVNAKVSQLLENGLILSFLQVFQGTVDLFHLRELAGEDWAAAYTVGDAVPARLLFTSAETGRVGLSLKPHLVAGRACAFPAAMAAGDIFLAATVKRVEPKTGLVLELPMAQRTTFERMQAEQPVDAADAADAQVVAGYAHISRVEDEHLEKLGKKYAVGTTHACRVLGTNGLDGLASVGLQPALLSQPVLRYEDVRPGMRLQAEVLSVQDAGVLLRITPKIRALCPSMHLADVQVTNPALKFKPEKKVTVRVLNVQPAAGRMTVTHKRTMVKSDAAILAKYEDAKPGVVADGFVNATKDAGVIVEFYGGVHGLVSASELQRWGVTQHPSAVYQKGQVVRCRVVSSKPAQQRMQLSFDLTPATTTAAAPAAGMGEETRPGAAEGRAAVGAVVRCAVVDPARAEHAGAATTLFAGQRPFLLVRVPLARGAAASKGGERFEWGCLPEAHCSDHVALAAEVAGALAAEATASAKGRSASLQLLVLSRDQQGRPLLSRKHSLLAAAEENQLPKVLEEVEVGALLRGFVRSVTDFGVFVGFLDGFVGLAPRNQLADRFVADPAALFRAGQSVWCRAVDVNGEKRRLTLSLKPSEVTDAPWARDWLLSHFTDTALLDAAAAAGAASGAADWAAAGLVAGGVARGAVSLVKSRLLALAMSTGAAAAAAAEAAAPAPPSSEAAAPKPKKKKRAADEDAADATPAAAESGDAGEEKNLYEEVADVSKRAEVTGIALRPAHTEEGAEYALGQALAARVLDVDRRHRIVDVSLRAVLLPPPPAAAAKKGKRAAAAAAAAAAESAWPQPEARVRVRVELAKRPYTVVALVGAVGPHGPLLGYAAAGGCAPNEQALEAAHRPQAPRQGQLLDALVVAAPEDDGTQPRLLLQLLPATAADADGAANDAEPRAAHKKAADAPFDEELASLADVRPGRLLRARVTGVSEQLGCLLVAFSARSGRWLQGRVAATELMDALPDEPCFPLRPWHKRVGQLVPLRVLAVEQRPAKAGAEDAPDKKPVERRAQVVHLSARPAALEEGAEPALVELGNLVPGRVVAGLVQQVDTEHGFLWLQLGPHVRGRVYTRELPRVRLPPTEAAKAAASGADNDDADDAAARPTAAVLRAAQLAAFEPGQVVGVAVLAVDAERHRVDLSVRRARSAELGALVSLEEEPARAAGNGTERAARAARAEEAPLQVDQVVGGRVARLLPGVGATIELDATLGGGALFGTAHLCDVCDDLAADPLASLTVGAAVRARVLAVERDASQRKWRVALSLRPSVVDGSACARAPEDARSAGGAGDLQPNQLVTGYVKRVDHRGCFVWLSRTLQARIVIAQLSDRYVKDVAAGFPPGKRVTGRVVGVDAEQGRVELSLRRSVVAPQKKRSPLTFASLREGQLVSASVKNVTKYGVFLVVRKSHGKLAGLCHITQLSDGYVKDAGKLFTPGQKVKAVIVSLDKEKSQVSFTMKPSAVAAASGTDADADASSDDEAAPKAPTAAAAASAAAAEKDDEEEEEEEKEEEDEEEKVAVPPPQKAKKNKAPAEETAAEAEPPQKRGKPAAAPAAAPAATPKRKPEATAAATPAAKAVKAAPGATPAAAARPADDDVPELNVLAAPAAAAAAAAAAADSESEADEADEAKGSGDESGEEGEAAADDDEEDDGKPGQTRRRAKRAAKKRAEKELRQREEALLDTDRAPQSAADFERLLLASPNSSFLWLQYIAFVLAQAEVDRARSVAERALSTISFREEAEKLNVWVALLGLENLYGTRATLAKAFERAVQHNNPKHVYLKMATLYQESGKAELASETLAAARRKFNTSAKVYIQSALFHFQQNDAGAAHALLKTALERLPKHKHVKVITHFAQLEYKHLDHGGSVERGRTVFDGLVASYPKRVDLLTVYIDMELALLRRLRAPAAARKRRDAALAEAALAAGVTADAVTAHVRKLFERGVHLKVSTQKVKFLYKRFLLFETEHGDAASVQHVKDSASAYVAGKLAS